MVASILLGTHILALFGIGGGLLLAAASWRMRYHSEDDDVHSAAAEEAAALTDTEIVRRSFFPMTFPLTTGPGTIAASIALGAQVLTTPILLYLVGSLALAGGAALVSLVLYFLFGNAASVLRWLGEIGTLVMMRLMAFILLCVGIQIMWNGWAELNK